MRRSAGKPAEIPGSIKGKTLRERFEEYHRRNPGQQAATPYLDDLVALRRPAPIPQLTNDPEQAETLQTPTVEARASAALTENASGSHPVAQKTQAVCLLKGIAPRNLREPEREVTTSPNGCQASASPVEARGPTAPSEIAQRAPKADLNAYSNSLRDTEASPSIRVTPGLPAPSSH